MWRVRLVVAAILEEVESCFFDKQKIKFKRQQGEVNQVEEVRVLLQLIEVKEEVQVMGG